jgi:hypothetical protein
MSLLDYKSFLLNESILNEATTGDELKAAFERFVSSLSKKRLGDIMKWGEVGFVMQTSRSASLVLGDEAYITVYPSTIKIRSAKDGSRLDEFPKSNKDLPSEFDYLKGDVQPTNKFEKAICFIVYLMKRKPEAIFWSPKDSLKKETIALQNIQNQLDKLKGPNESVKLVVKGEMYNSTGLREVELEKADKVQGTPKADFILEIKGDPSIYISHKDGKTAKDFQQYGGISECADHPFVKKFLETIKEKFGTDAKNWPANEFAVPIPKEYIDLGIRAIFGNLATTSNKNWSADNIQVVMQGAIEFIPAGEPFENGYVIKPTGHAMYNPAITGNKLELETNDPYWPALYVSMRTGQGGTFGFQNARFGIWAQGNNAVSRGIEKWNKAQ